MAKQSTSTQPATGEKRYVTIVYYTSSDHTPDNKVELAFTEPELLDLYQGKTRWVHLPDDYFKHPHGTYSLIAVSAIAQLHVIGWEGPKEG